MRARCVRSEIRSGLSAVPCGTRFFGGHAYPALPCRAFTCRRYAPGAQSWVAKGKCPKKSHVLMLPYQLRAITNPCKIYLADLGAFLDFVFPQPTQSATA